MTLATYVTNPLLENVYIFLFLCVFIFVNKAVILMYASVYSSKIRLNS